MTASRYQQSSHGVRASWRRRRLLGPGALAIALVVLAVGTGSIAAAVVVRTPSSSHRADAAAPDVSQSADAPLPATALARQARFQAAVRPSKLYFGVATPDMPYSTTLEKKFAAAAGKTPDVVEYYQSFSSDMDIPALRSIAADGQLPIITWEPWDYLKPTTNPDPVQDIAGGQFDNYLRAQALLLKSFDGLVGLRLAPEMNGSWFPWGQLNASKNSPADYVAMWRHVHDIFTSVGASNVIWIWSPNIVAGQPGVTLAPLYPGNAYVDIVGVVGYLISPDKTLTFAKLYDGTLSQLNVFAASKPILIAETGVAPTPSQVPLLWGLFAGILTTPRVIGFIWFNYGGKVGNGQADWRLELHPQQAAVFRRVLANPRFGGIQH